MTRDEYVNMSVDDLTTELNTLQTNGSNDNLKHFIDCLIEYKREKPDDTNLLAKLKNQTTLSRQPATTQPNLPGDLLQAYRSVRQSGGKRRTKKSRKSKKSRKTKRRR